jgi:hypothetical protein
MTPFVHILYFDLEPTGGYRELAGSEKKKPGAESNEPAPGSLYESVVSVGPGRTGHTAIVRLKR